MIMVNQYLGNSERIIKFGEDKGNLFGRVIYKHKFRVQHAVDKLEEVEKILSAWCGKRLFGNRSIVTVLCKKGNQPALQISQVDLVFHVTGIFPLSSPTSKNAGTFGRLSALPSAK